MQILLLGAGGIIIIVLDLSLVGLVESKTNVKELKEKVREFCEDRDWGKYHNAKDLAIGITTESAELLDHFRFKSEAEVEQMLNDPSKKAEISDEMADTLYFLLRLAQRYDIDLVEALNKKMVKNKKKYPIEKVRGSNKKYMEL